MSFKQIIRLVLLVPLFYYIYLSFSNNYYIKLKGKPKLIINDIKFNEEGVFTYNISNESWPFKNNLINEILLLSIDIGGKENIKYNQLVFKTSAYSEYHGKKLNRLILSPFINGSDTTKLNNCKSSSGKYRIGLINILENEDILIKISIIHKDKRLNLNNTSLIIESYKGSPEVFGFGIFNIYLNIIILVISIFCLFVYVRIGFNNESKLTKNINNNLST